MPVKGEFVGHMPVEEPTGNYVVFDLLTDQQWIAHLFQREDELMVLDGKTHTVVPAANYDKPNYRWVRVIPLSRSEIESYLKTPA